MLCRSWIRSGQTAIRIPSKFPHFQLAPSPSSAVFFGFRSPPHVAVALHLSSSNHILYYTHTPFNALSSSRTNSVTSSSARFLTDRSYISIPFRHNHPYSSYYSYFSPLNNHGQMCVLFPLVLNETRGLIQFLPLNSFALAPFATTLGLHPHPGALR